MRMRGPSCLKQNLFFIALLYFRLFFCSNIIVIVIVSALATLLTNKTFNSINLHATQMSAYGRVAYNKYSFY